MAKRSGVLFLCVANSARSQMAEGFARARAKPGTAVFSAGSDPSHVNLHAVAVMHEVGVDISGQRSKSIADIDADRIDAAITLCAEEVCPTFSHPVRQFHWPIDDPAAATGTKNEVRRAFRVARDRIHDAVDGYFDAIELSDDP